MPHQSLTVLFRSEEESWNAFLGRIQEAESEVIVIFGVTDELEEEKLRKQFLDGCAVLRSRVRIATHDRTFAAQARKLGMRVYDTTPLLRGALSGHAQLEEALRVFSPSHWRQKWRSHLQSIGILSMPKVRIGFLIFFSLALFLFVVFRLLPSAEIRVTPRGDIATQTTNVFLILSGATVDLPSHARTMLLHPIDVRLTKEIVFDQISKQFNGTNAEVPMTVVNHTTQDVLLRKGTRLRNQAGMLFRTKKTVTIPADGMFSVAAKADELDAYGEIIGDRGNVPAGVRWEFPGLSAEEQAKIFAENRVPGTGGKTEYRTVLQKGDLDIAQRRLQQELLSEAKKEVDTEVAAKNLALKQELRVLTSDQLVRATFTGVTLPLDLLDQPVSSVKVSGTLLYRVLAYDAPSMLEMAQESLESHVSTDKRIVPDSVNLKHLDLRVFDYADDLSWIKATVELIATEEFILDPFTPTGARFAGDVRAKVAGLPQDEAARIIKNLPEVEKVQIRLWPPWNHVLPSIPSNMTIVTP